MMPTPPDNRVYADAQSILSELRCFRAKEPVRVTLEMDSAVRRLTRSWLLDRQRLALAELYRRGYLFHRALPPRNFWDWVAETETWFDPAGKGGVVTAPHPDPKPTRPTRDEIGMKTAELWATMSVDPKHRVGSAILGLESKKVYAVGYNGRYPDCPTEDRFSMDQYASEFSHAERNAMDALEYTPREPLVLYVTHEPCDTCALGILTKRAGARRLIKRVVYRDEYAPTNGRRRGADILREAGVEVVQWTL